MFLLELTAAPDRGRRRTGIIEQCCSTSDHTADVDFVMHDKEHVNMVSCRPCKEHTRVKGNTNFY